MADSKRWIVTYTKHIKQKRKVYQDGFLELHESTNKLLLYDDCEKLMECKILKRDETVGCGETLAFNGFLVDVSGTAQGNCSHSPPSSLGRGDRSGIEKSRFQKRSLSPSQKIIRDFKKREALKYEAMQQSKSPEMAKSSVTEWEALYTTQITQKAKKYRDGFVQLSVRGFHGRQVMLLDSSHNNIASRFLKKDDKVESGGTIAFEGYIVEVGDPLGDHNRSQENNLDAASKENEATHGHRFYAYWNKFPKESIKSEFQKKMESHGDQQETSEPSTTEWKVLYTAQLTQKSKKYHDGFLQLEICGSRGRQGILLDMSKTILHSRFLRKEEVIRTGVSFKFDAYLIDIGEGNNGINSTDVGNKETPREQSSLSSKSSALKGKSLANACFKKASESNFSISKVETVESVKRVPMNKPLRDASQILSFLQKPKIENSAVSCYEDDKPPVDLGILRDNQPLNLKPFAQHNQSSEIADTTTSRESMVLDITPDTIFSKDFAAMPNSGISSQKLYSDTEADTGCHDEGNASNMSFSCGPVDVKDPSDGPSCTMAMDEFPSFDLGF